MWKSLSLLLAFCTVQGIAQEGYQVDVLCELVTFKKKTLDQIRRGRPNQMLDLATLSRLRCDGKGHILYAPRVRMNSGREVSFKSVEEVIFPTELTLNAFTNANGITTLLRPDRMETREAGCCLQVVPSVVEETMEISIGMQVEIVELSSWRTYHAKIADERGRERSIDFPQPFFHTQSFSTSVNLTNGQTAIVGGDMTDKGGKNTTFCFVTAKIVNSAGEMVLKRHAPANPPAPCDVLAPELRTVIFPQSRAAELIKRVCYSEPPGISGYWTPIASDLVGVEERLTSFLERQVPKEKIPWPEYHKQVAGIMVGDELFLFISYFWADSLESRSTKKENASVERWKREPIWGFDGGSIYFRVVYDLKQKKFVWFQCNGRA